MKKKIGDLTEEEKSRICDFYCEDFCYKCPYKNSNPHNFCNLYVEDKEILDQEIEVDEDD